MKTESRQAFWASMICALIVSVLGACQFLVESQVTVRELLGEDVLVALEAGDVEGAREILRTGLVPDGRDRASKTALMIALELGEPGLALELIESGIDLEVRDGLGASALFYAVRSGEAAVVKALLDRGMSPKEDVPGIGQLVAYATETGRMASARLLMEAGASKRARTVEGTPVLFLAAERGATWLLKDILDAGVGMDLQNTNGDTLAHTAVRCGRSDMMEILWRRGVDPNVVNLGGETLLHVALAEGRFGLVPALLERGAEVGGSDRMGRQPMHVALEQGDIETLHRLLEHGADPNATGPDGRSLLDRALEKREFALAQVLADYYADLGGHLRGAVAAGDTELFGFLMRNEVPLDLSGGAKVESPLAMAVRGGHAGMAVVLLEAGADPNAKGKEGQPLLHLALALNNPGMVKLLVQNGANVNTEFSYPADDEFVKLVKWEGLIKWFLQKDRRVTPLMMAADCGSVPMTRLLIDYGAKKHVTTRRHRHWPVNFASRGGHIGVMQLMLGRDPDQPGRTVTVDLSEQQTKVFEKDGSLLFSTRISSGKKGYRTKTGTFVITNKYKSWKSTIYKGASMPYFQRLSCGDFGFHRGYVPKYAASHGCIRVPAGNAAKLFSLTSTGDVVTIVD